MIEIPPFDEPTVERLWRRATDLRHEPDHRLQRLMDQAMNAARKRSPRLLAGLERCIEVIDRQAENQSGQTRRQAKGALRIPPTEVNVFRSAYETVESNQAAEPLILIYIAVGEYVGVVM